MDPPPVVEPPPTIIETPVDNEPEHDADGGEYREASPATDFVPSDDHMSDASEEEFKAAPPPSKGKGKKSKKAKEKDEDADVKPSGPSFRCHQCRNPPSQGAEIIRCTDLRRYDATGKTLKTPRRCEAGFCSRCLLNRYDSVITPDKRSEWTCPVCRLNCNCARCRRKKGLQPTGQLLARAKELGVDSAQAALALSPQKPVAPENARLQVPEAGPSTTKRAVHPRERTTRPEGTPLVIPDDAPSFYDCLHLREFMYRFKWLCYDMGPQRGGSVAAQTALAELDDLVNIWSTEKTPRIVLRGLLRCLQRDNSLFGSPLRKLINRPRLEQAQKETHTQWRWGDKCWRTAKPIADGEEVLEQIPLPPIPNGLEADGQGDASVNMEALEGINAPEEMQEDGVASADDSMEVDEDEANRAELLARLPSPVEKVRILTKLAELAMHSEMLRADLQQGVDIAIGYRATMAKAKKEASDIKVALKTELAEAKGKGAGAEEMQELEQKLADHEYNSRADLAVLYVDTVSKRTRFSPLFSVDGVDFYLPTVFTASVPLEPDNLASCSSAIIAHRAADGQKGWSVYQGVTQLRQLADWADSELKHKQYQIAKANAAAAEAAEAASKSSPAPEGQSPSSEMNGTASDPPRHLVMLSSLTRAGDSSGLPLLASDQDMASAVESNEPKKEPTAESQFADTGPQLTLVDTIQPLRAFVEFVEFKLDIEPPYRTANADVHWRQRSAITTTSVPVDEQIDELED